MSRILRISSGRGSESDSDSGMKAEKPENEAEESRMKRKCLQVCYVEYKKH